MPQLYTPFFERGAANLGNAYMQSQQKQELQQLTKAAYMGDQQAMAQLTAINPQVATQIQQSQRQVRQDEISQSAAAAKTAAGERDVSIENQDILAKILAEGAKLDTFAEAQAYVDNKISSYGGALGDIDPLDEETYNQVREMAGVGAGPSDLDIARTEEIKAKTAKLKAEKTGQPKLTDAQAKAAGFYGRMIGSQGEIDRVFDESPTFKPAALSETAPAAVSNMLASVEFQQYKQAADDWIRAKLRRESGAVIATDEMEKEYSTYFPVFGDSKQVIEQKKRARKKAEDGMRKGAGPAKFDDINPGKKEVRRGQHNGKTVIEYADGTVEYAD